MKTRNNSSQLTIAEKVNIIRSIDRGVAQATLAYQFKVNKSTISRLNRKKSRKAIESILESDMDMTTRKRISNVQNSEIDDKTLEYVKECRARNINVTGTMIQGFARDTFGILNADFKASNGWLQSFVNRHNIRFNSRPSKADDETNEKSQC